MKLTSIKLSIFIILIILAKIDVGATNWYVSNSGNDSNSGNSPSDAIATIAELNTKILQPGDSVLFERGGVWRLATDDALEVNQSGTANNYIVYTAYGVGDAPRLLGSNQITGWTNAGGNIWQATLNYNPRETGYGAELFCEDGDNVFWTLNVNGDGGYSGMTEDLDWYWESNTVYLYSTEDPDTRFTSVEAPRTVRHIYLNNNEYITIDNLELCYTTNIGIYDAYGSANISGLRVTNCHIHHIGHKDSGQAFGLSVKHSDMYIANNDIHDCGRRNISLVTYDTSPSMYISNILIENNYLHHGWHTTGVDINTTGDHYYDSLVIRNNYFYDPLDDDISDEPPNKSLTSNHIFCADQGGGTFTKVYVYNNIFHGHKGNGVLMQGVDQVRVYYNTFYGFNSTLSSYASFVSTSNCQDIDVLNNVFYNDGDPDFNKDNYMASINDPTSYQNTDMDYNLWYREQPSGRVFIFQNIGGAQSYYIYSLNQWEEFKSEMEYEANSPDPANPNFLNAANNNFNLQEGSPAIGQATPISFVTTDYYGNTRNPSTPTLGAIEYGNYVSREANIESFEIPGQIGGTTIDTDQNTISIVMPFGISLVNLVPTISISLGATISPETGISNDFSSSVEYVVTAEDGTTVQTWEVTVTNAALSEETDIESFSILGQVGETTIDNSLHTVSILMPNNTNLGSLTPDVSVSAGASISPESGTPQDFSSPVEYVVTAEDGITTQSWVISVTNAEASKETDVLTFIVQGQVVESVINTTQHTVEVLLPYGANLGNLSPDVTVSAGASISPESGVSQDFSSPVEYIVTAEDGTTTQSWEVTVTNDAASQETDIISFSISGQVGQSSINSTEHTVQVVMPLSASITDLSPTIEVSPGATIAPASGVSQDFTSTVTYTVTAEDNLITQEWNVEVVQNALPVISISLDDEIIQNKVFKIDASGSASSNGSPLSFAWEIPQSFAASSLSEDTILLIAPATGEYTVRLTVNDGGESSEEEFNITVDDFNTFSNKINIVSAEASGSQEGNPPEDSYDENIETRWSSEGNGEWILYTLEEKSFISHFEIAFYRGTLRHSYFEIHASEDKQSWDLIYQNGQSCGFYDNLEVFDLSFDETTTNSYNYLRITGHANSELENDWNSFSEVNIYGVEDPGTFARHDTNSDKLSVYPNPSSNYFNITVNDSKILDIRIVDINGRILLEKNNIRESNTIEHNLKEGVYILQCIEKGTVTEYHKIIVE